MKYNTLRGLPSPVKGDRFRAYFRRNSCVRIAPLAPNFKLTLDNLLLNSLWTILFLMVHLIFSFSQEFSRISEKILKNISLWSRENFPRKFQKIFSQIIFRFIFLHGPLRELLFPCRMSGR